ncbi:MAG: hypothetical protein JKX76_01595 [Colwellia sp.]|nr:hypothetical protein [Colwellia sp.]
MIDKSCIIVIVITIIVLVVFVTLAVYYWPSDNTENLINENGELEEGFQFPGISDDNNIRAMMKLKGCPTEYEDDIFDMSKLIYSQKVILDDAESRDKLKTLSKLPVENENILMLALSTGDRPFAKKTLATLESYADKHGYDFEVQRDPVEIPNASTHKNVKNANFGKLFMLNNRLNNPDYDKYSVIAYLDDDILFCNNPEGGINDIRLENILELAGTDKSLVIGRDKHVDTFIFPYKPYFNSGFFMIRNNEIGKHIIQQTVDNYYNYDAYSWSSYNDQSALEHEYLMSVILETDTHRHWGILNHSVIQSLYNADIPNRGGHTFACHMAGSSAKKRLKIIKDFEKKGYIN